MRVVSDPFPTILEGVPLQVRTINVHVDRDGFMVNPTSCEPTEVRAQAMSIEGTTATLRSRFQVGGCAALDFSPRLAMRLIGKGRMRSGRNPGLRAVVTQPSGQANIKRARVALPRDLILDPERAQDDAVLCPYEKGLAVACPGSSVIGRATAVSPLLKRPLSGPVYFVQGKRRDPDTGNLIRTLPGLLVKLRGEIALDLRSTSHVTGSDRLVATFPIVPDARVSKFTLSLKGGPKRGVLEVAENPTGKLSLCDKSQNAGLAIRGHNGRLADRTVRLKTPCPKGKPKRLELRRKR